MVRPGAVVCFFLFSVLACSPSLKSVQFEFDHQGTTIKADKQFNDGFGLEPSTRAWPSVEKKQFDEAIAILSEVTGEHPEDAWAHYNLAVLYEVVGKWDMAEAVIRDAIVIEDALAKKEGRTPIRAFQSELRYIERYQ